MLGRILGAVVGQKLASRSNRGTGALIGMALPMIARRGLGPLGLALGLGWGAKKLLDARQARRGTTFPASATPASPVSTTRSPS